MNLRRACAALGAANVVLVAILVIALTGPTTTAAAGSPPSSAPATTVPPATTAPPATTVPSTTVPSTTVTSTTVAPQPPAEPRAEPARDPDVAAVQARLAELGYDPGPADGVFGARTASAVMAFQKVEGLARDGRIGPEVASALAGATAPSALVPDGEPTRIEIDLSRQVLLFWEDGELATVLPTSTGNGEHYCVGGDCDVAVTPTGTYRVGRKYAGTEVGPLGALHYPMYFNGGIAVHGSPSVPAHPASHGCARIPMWAAPVLFDRVPPGTAVHVVE